ncbi:MAG: hypothetical protein QM742_18750 [Aquabacterium sp.]
MQLDWQTLATLGIGLLALAYLLRRWWPAARGRMGKSATACGTPAGAASQGGATCGTGTGCGQCGQSQATPSRDHRAAQPVAWHPRSTPRGSSR